MGFFLPKWIANNEECNIRLVRSSKNIIARALYHFAISHNDRPVIVGFLLLPNLSFRIVRFEQAFLNFSLTCAYQLLNLDEQDSSVCFEIYSFGSLDDFKTFDGDIPLVGKAEPNKVKHDFKYYQNPAQFCEIVDNFAIQ